MTEFEWQAMEIINNYEGTCPGWQERMQHRIAQALEAAYKAGGSTMKTCITHHAGCDCREEEFERARTLANWAVGHALPALREMMAHACEGVGDSTCSQMWFRDLVKTTLQALPEEERE
jgi:hypothetical protein